jgi:hypothetical protein
MTMASDAKTTKATTKADPAPKKEAAAAPAKTAEAAPAKAANATPAATTDASPAKAADAAPASYSRGEGQKPVTQAYKDNWNAIFATKKTKKKTVPKKANKKTAAEKKTRARTHKTRRPRFA